MVRQEQRLELRTLWGFVLRRWWLMGLPALVAIVLLLPTLPALLSPPTTYSVAMRFTAAAPSDTPFEGNPQILVPTYEDTAYVPWLASEYVVVNLPQWVTSDSFAREVSAVLAERNINIAAEDVRPAFVADAARSILVVYINWDDEAEIRAIAEAAIEVLQTRNQTYFPQFAATPAQVVPLDDVRVNAVAPPLTARLSPFLRVGVALALGVMLALAAEYLDNTVRGVEDLQEIDLPPLGVIPH